ncbi:MAG TPA: CAP domain-containing protein [Flavobacteriales bacterium]|nr:CAP domain-containing protein [Flavobacteriales bacterium]
MIRTLFIMLFCFGLSIGFSQTNSKFKKYKPEEICVSAEELQLYDLLNEYRKKHSLPSISLSKALCYIAQIHAEDLELNVKALTHAWSTCKYNAQVSKTYGCMWDKPKELTTYKGTGYECAHGGTGDYKATAQSALEGWQNSKSHNDVILNKDIWKGDTWNAIGVGIYGSFATIWFGTQKDEDGITVRCP